MADSQKIENKNQFDERLRDTVLAVQREVENEVKGRKWKSAYSDTRGGTGNSGTVEKFAIEYADGKVDRSGFAPLDVTYLVDDVWECRKAIFAREWYGIRITVFPDGKHSVDYNYDPNCLNDSNFIDVDED